MTKKDKAKYIIEELENLYPTTLVPLDHTDAYTLLIAVLLSAQCTDKRVNLVTPELFALANNPYDMIKLTVPQIRAIIRPCGLSPRKSQAIYDLSHMIIDKYQGEVPQELALLEEFPRVGHKTASVVVAQIWDIPAFPVDTHIHRLLTRWGITSGKNVTETERDAVKIFPKDKWNKLHLQIIFYGREYSPARSPLLAVDFITREIGTKKALLELK